MLVWSERFLDAPVESFTEQQNNPARWNNEFSADCQNQMLLGTNSMYKCSSDSSLRKYSTNKLALLSTEEIIRQTNCIPDVRPSRAESSGLTSDPGAAGHSADFTLWSRWHHDPGFGFRTTLIYSGLISISRDIYTHRRIKVSVWLRRDDVRSTHPLELILSSGEIYRPSP